MYFKKLSLLFLLVLIMMGCAKERPIKHVLPEIQRVEKASFTTDDYYYNVTVVLRLKPLLHLLEINLLGHPSCDGLSPKIP